MKYQVKQDGIEYRYWLDDDIVAIEDLKGERNVTLHVEEVLAHIEQEEGSLAGKYVIYADTQGVWDAIAQLGQSLTIRPLGGLNYPEACQLLRGRIIEHGPATYLIQDYLFNP